VAALNAALELWRQAPRLIATEAMELVAGVVREREALLRGVA
jgi:hypothetical protein